MRGSLPNGAWVAVHVCSNMERHVLVSLTERNYESFLPTYKTKRKWCDRTVELELPLFRGYLFCRWDNENRHPILKVPGVIRIVGFGKMAACVDEDEIAALQRIVNSDVAAMPWKFVRAGDRVRLTCGALCGLEGVFVRASSNHYIVVNVTLMNRAVAAKVHPSQIAPCVGVLNV
jgi:transcription antitermination factor NusG